MWDVEPLLPPPRVTGATLLPASPQWSPRRAVVSRLPALAPPSPSITASPVPGPQELSDRSPPRFPRLLRGGTVWLGDRLPQAPPPSCYPEQPQGPVLGPAQPMTMELAGQGLPATRAGGWAELGCSGGLPAAGGGTERTHGLPCS